MRALTKALMAALWTGALILTVVVAVDGQEATRYEHEVREDARTQLDVVRSNLGEGLDRRFELSDRLAAFVDASPEMDEERFDAYAASLAASQHGIRSLRLIPIAGEPLVYPDNLDGRAAYAAAPDGLSTDPRLVGPYRLPGGSSALVIVKPVHLLSTVGPGSSSPLWGAAWVEFYLEPLLGEAKVVGWPGDVHFAIRGNDGIGESGEAFYGDAGLFASKPLTSLVTFRGGQWQVAAAPAEGWPEGSPATWWIRIGGGVMALMASILVGVLVSEPSRLRGAVETATKSAQESEERFRSVSDSAQDAILTIDDDGRLTYANRAAETLYGHRRGVLLGARIQDLLPAEAKILDRAGERQDENGHGDSTEEVVSLRRDGTEVPVEVSTASWSVGGRRYRTAIIRDVTERKRVQEEQARLAAVLDTSPDFIAIADPHGRLQYLNRAASQFFRMDGDDVAHGRLVDLFPEDMRREFWENALPAALRNGAWRGHSNLRGADGRRLSVSGVLLAHHDADGRLAAIALVARDITDEKHAQDDLRREKERFRTLSEAAFEGIVIHDEGKVLEANGAFARMLGIPMEDLIGRGLLDLIVPSDRGIASEHLRSPRAAPCEVGARHADGTEFPVELAARHFPFKDRVVQVVAVRDVTERRKAEAAQRVATERLNEIERLKEIDQFKTQLLNTASHELNTPITPIRLQLHLLKNTHLGDLSDKHRKAIDVLDRNVERLALLVQDVLDVARLQSGRLKVYREPLEVETLVKEAVEAFEEPARQAKIRLDTEVRDNIWIAGDGHRLTQVLFNLLSNALKFTPAHGTITVQARTEAGRAVVVVTDSGAGLTEPQIRRLFRPFSQVHDTMQTTRSGTGLGLYISKGIIEEHEGTVWCESPGVGRGATFGFNIPLASAEELVASQKDTKTKPARTEHRHH